MSAPINPSDYLFAYGHYGDKSWFTSIKDGIIGMGFEGSGEISEVGLNIDASHIGERIAFIDDCTNPTYTGSWRQYKVFKYDWLIKYPKTA